MQAELLIILLINTLIPYIIKEFLIRSVYPR